MFIFTDGSGSYSVAVLKGLAKALEIAEKAVIACGGKMAELCENPTSQVGTYGPYQFFGSHTSPDRRSDHSDFVTFVVDACTGAAPDNSTVIPCLEYGEFQPIPASNDNDYLVLLAVMGACCAVAVGVLACTVRQNQHHDLERGDVTASGSAGAIASNAEGESLLAVNERTLRP